MIVIEVVISSWMNQPKCFNSGTKRPSAKSVTESGFQSAKDVEAEEVCGKSSP